LSSFVFTGSPATRQPAFAARHTAWYPASYPGPATWRSSHTVLVSCCLSATGVRFLGILCPPGDWALLTVGLPAHQQAYRTLTGFPCSARVRHDWGWTSSIPRGQRCSHGRDWSTTAACRITTASSLSPRYCIPTRRVVLTRHHQGFPVSHPMPNLPLTCRPRTGQGPLGFPRELRTQPLPATHVTVGTGLEH
jgi:hypothetical protein